MSSSEEGPEWLVWIVTGQCNLRCPYCYATHYEKEEPLKGEHMVRVLKEAASTGVEYINYTGGEPLLREDILEILRQTVDLGIEASLFTNLTLVSESIASELSRLNVFILTSLDGPEEVYERVKGEGTWRKFTRSIEIIRELGLPFHVNVTISKINHEVVGEAIVLASELGAESISVIPSMAFGRAKETGTYISRGDFLRSLLQIEKVAEELGIYVSVWCAPFLESLRGFRRLYYSNCRGWREMDISPSGKVLSCDAMGIELANVLEDGILGSWVKLNAHPFYLRVKVLPEQCSGCITKRCMGGCYARAYHHWGKLPAPDPLCPKVKLTADVVSPEVKRS